MTADPDGSERFDVAVIGGGAAGLIAALFAARAGRRAALLEGSKACGLKILVSGGGRCNVLPSECALDDFFTSGSRNVMRRIMATWPLADVRRFFEEDIGIELALEPETGKLFPRSGNARVVRDRLVAACRAAGASVLEGWRVESIEREGDELRVGRRSGGSLMARRVVLATGGRSLPKTGSDGAGYELARSLGHTLLPTYPALVPLTTSDAAFHELAGVSVPVLWRARLSGRVVEERTRELLFTHRGFSGPAVLDASHWAVRDGAALSVGWNGRDAAYWTARLRESQARDVFSVVGAELPKRLARLLCDRTGVPPGMRCGNIDRELRRRLIACLADHELPIEGDAGYGVAEVTGGGVPLAEVDPSTLESRATRGLFICGEILDIVGRIGGYNFLWAWVTGRLAGEAAARSC